MFSFKELVLGYVILYLNPLYLIMGFLYLFKIKYYIIQDREVILNIIKKMTPHIYVPCQKHVNGKDIPIGYFVGKQYVGFIEYVSQEYKLYFITSESIYKEIIKTNIVFHETETETEEIKESKINLYTRKGMYKNFYYTSMNLDMSHIMPMGDQDHVIQDILSIYRKKNRATVFIHGNTSTGKSSIGYLLAKELNGIYCHSFNPSEPGDQLSSFITDVVKDEEPIIIVLEEVDTILKAIHSEKIQKSPDIPTQVYNKTSWSNFLDDMIFYKEVILVMTSNTSKEEIDQMDPAYLRDGRIHANYTMNHVIQPL